MPLVIGYLLGSILPAYFLTRMMLGIDIRSVGSGHAGTTNVYREVGLWPAVVTAFYDSTKGILAIQIAEAMGYPDYISFLSGYFAVIGHVFPFYLHFRGGKGAATTVGLLLFSLWNTWLTLPFPTLLTDLFFLLLIVSVLSWTTKKGDVVGIFVLPALSVLLTLRRVNDIWFIWLLIVTLMFINLKNILEEKLIELDEAGWRVFIRPTSFLLFVLGMTMEKGDFLLLTTVVFSVFFLADVVRLLSKRIHRFFHEELEFKIYRKDERKQISSISLFLLGVILSFLLFDKHIAFTAGCFLAFGDMAAKIIGASFGKRKLFDKTVEGTMVGLVIDLFIAYAISLSGLLDLSSALIGGLTATVCEILPLSIDDNVSVPLCSSLVMSLL
ncbi:glycerol-3-phosphate acyltransferase [Thermotoga sp. KOL6]|uniref:glycerol-3-phosphate acyltransferase n=1 Tax=Thermotoga sp. KOL6 TaxID=126741 RepID=UPI001E4E28BC|nr:glycerol-3-phosphate acyltransferase [Thermotoga sp. KOL6]